MAAAHIFNHANTAFNLRKGPPAFGARLAGIRQHRNSSDIDLSCDFETPSTDGDALRIDPTPYTVSRIANKLKNVHIRGPIYDTPAVRQASLLIIACRRLLFRRWDGRGSSRQWCRRSAETAPRRYRSSTPTGVGCLNGMPEAISIPSSCRRTLPACGPGGSPKDLQNLQTLVGKAQPFLMVVPAMFIQDAIDLSRPSPWNRQ